MGARLRDLFARCVLWKIMADQPQQTSRSDGGSVRQSARLMDTANSMLRHLGDMTTRRQAAEHALMQRISDSEENSLEMHAAVDGQADSIVAQQGTEEWVKEMVELVHEAKQSGVA